MSIEYVSQWNDTIKQGATFTRRVKLTEPVDSDIPYHPDTNSRPVDLTGKVVRSTLMLAKNGAHAANFACAVVGDPTAGEIAWTMPRAVTAGLDPQPKYFHNIYLDDEINETSDPVQEGDIRVDRGQGLPPSQP